MGNVHLAGTYRSPAVYKLCGLAYDKLLPLKMAHFSLIL